MFVLDALGTLVRIILDVLLLPFRGLPPFWGLLFISLLAGLGMIQVFGRVSDQNAISRLRKRMTGEVLGILLHVSRPGTVMRFAGKLIVSNFIYLWHIFKPLLVLAVPFALLWGQLEARYATGTLFEEMNPVTMTLSYGSLPSAGERSLESNGISFYGPVMQVDTLREVSFRMVALNEEPKTLIAGEISVPVGRSANWSGAIIYRGFGTGRPLERLFKPWLASAEDLPGDPLAGRFELSAAEYVVLGGHWSWLAVFLVFSSLSALAGAKLFRVRI